MLLGATGGTAAARSTLALSRCPPRAPPSCCPTAIWGCNRSSSSSSSSSSSALPAAGSRAAPHLACRPTGPVPSTTRPTAASSSLAPPPPLASHARSSAMSQPPAYSQQQSATPAAAAAGAAAATATAPAAAVSVSAAAGPTGQQQHQPASDPVVQYVVLRRDLWGDMKWPLGSVVAQACHAATAAMWLHREDPVTQAYLAPENVDHMHKVVLEVKGEAALRTLSQKLSEAGVGHKLWTEQPEDFVTCLATKPYPKSQVAAHFKKFQLCKAPLGG